MNKQKALELFEAWWDDYDMRAAFQAARINREWPDVIVDEGDNDWQLGLYVGWMNAMKARAALASEHERELVEALVAIRDYGSSDGRLGIPPDEWAEKWGTKFGEMKEAEIAEQTLAKHKPE